MWLKIRVMCKFRKIISFFADEKGKLGSGKKEKQNLRVFIGKPESSGKINFNVASVVLFSLLEKAGLLPLREENE